MRMCPNCAVEIEDGVTVCPFCAADVTQAATAATHSAPGRHANGLGSKTWRIVAIIGRIGIVALAAVAVLEFLRYAEYNRDLAREGVLRRECEASLTRIGLALQSYHDAYGSFPPAYVADETGRPMHSWRVLILPFLDESELYDAYDFSQPWNSPANRDVLDNMPSVYRCPSHPDDRSSSMTHYAGVYGPDCVFNKPDDASGAPKAIRVSDITDGVGGTLMVGEASNAGIPWTKPEDVDITRHPALNDPGGFSSHHRLGVNFVYCEGTVQTIQEAIRQSVWNRILTINGEKAAPPINDQEVSTRPAKATEHIETGPDGGESQ